MIRKQQEKKPPQVSPSDNRGWQSWSDGVLMSFTVTERAGKTSSWYKSCILKCGLKEMHLPETSNIYYLLQAWLVVQSEWRLSSDFTASLPQEQPRLPGLSIAGPSEFPTAPGLKLINRFNFKPIYLSSPQMSPALSRQDPLWGSNPARGGTQRIWGRWQGWASWGLAPGWPLMWRASASVSSRTGTGLSWVRGLKSLSYSKAAPGIPWQASQSL